MCVVVLMMCGCVDDVCGCVDDVCGCVDVCVVVLMMCVVVLSERHREELCRLLCAAITSSTWKVQLVCLKSLKSFLAK